MAALRLAGFKAENLEQARKRAAGCFGVEGLTGVPPPRTTVWSGGLGRVDCDGTWIGTVASAARSSATVRLTIIAVCVEIETVNLSVNEAGSFICLVRLKEPINTPTSFEEVLTSEIPTFVKIPKRELD
ncbi:MAG TPA: hypothetical protein PJ982_17295 [Lacipirellulaceae bacterium]|nr:hypothetical protein [Lacipirellulaceae bacterium]